MTKASGDTRSGSGKPEKAEGPHTDLTRRRGRTMMMIAGGAAAGAVPGGFNIATLVRREGIVKLKATTKTAALAELAELAAKTLAAAPGPAGAPDAQTLLGHILEREQNVNTRLGSNWAVPHARLPGLPEPLLMLVGRSPDGVDYDGATGEAAKVNLIVLLLAREDEAETYLSALAALVAALKDPDRIERVLRASGPRALRAALTGASAGRRTLSRELPRVTRTLIGHMLRFADDMNVGFVFLDLDAFEDPRHLISVVDKRTILVSVRKDLPPALVERAAGIVSLPFPVSGTDAVLRLAIVLALGRKLVSRKERVLGLTGPRRSDSFDLMRLYQTKDFSALNLDRAGKDLIAPGVLERLIELGAAIGREGREGSAVGTTFVVGDEENVAHFTRQLIINPFRGYDNIELSVLDVTLEETIKEFASIDGAFIVAGSGRILSAGTYLNPPSSVDIQLPGGYGTRHTSAAAMTAVTKAIAVVVSASTGTVSVFADKDLVFSLETSERRTG